MLRYTVLLTPLLICQQLNIGSEQCTEASEQLVDNNNNKDTASPSDKLDSAKYESGTKNHPAFDKTCIFSQNTWLLTCMYS